MLREFERYRDLVKRPNVAKQLVSERETLLGQLSVYLKTARADFSVRYVSYHCFKITQGI